MRNYREMSDTDLLFSTGSHRPQRGVGLGELINPMSDEQLKEAQQEYDLAVAEMNRRDQERFFPYHIPKSA